ncbi:MAG: hypothetical protein DSY80_01620, partial [Desulfocapsa sp.]
GDEVTGAFDGNASLKVTHTYVGDLVASVDSPAGTNVELFNRPGKPATTYGCSQDNLFVTFDDEASVGANVENICSASETGTNNPGPPYAISGTYFAQGGTGNELAVFDGEIPNGDWHVNFIDNEAQDVGNFAEACLIIEVGALTMEEWISTDATCSDQLATINVPVDTELYHCYEVINGGTENFTVNAGNVTNDRGYDFSSLEGIYFAQTSRTLVEGPFTAGGAEFPVGTTTTSSAVTVNGTSANFTSAQTLSTTESVAVTVFSTNSAPTDIAIDGGGTDTVDENSASGTVVGTLTTTDSDAGDTHTYSLTCATAGADDDKFQIAGSDLQTNTVFNFEAPSDANGDGTYEVCVKTDDGNGGTYEKTLTITINDVVDSENILAQIGNEGDDPDNTNSVVTVAQLGLIEPALNNVDANNETAYQDYIDANPDAFSEPATPAEVQTMIDSVNAAQTVLANIGTDADNGNNDNTGTLSASDLNNIVGVSGATAANEQAYQDYIASHPNAFSSPATAAEVQAMIDAVNTQQVALQKIQDYADDNTNPAPTVQDYLDAGITGVDADNLDAVNSQVDAVAGTDADTVAEIQALADNGDLLEKIGTDEGDGAATTTNPTATQLNAIVGVSGATAANEQAYQDYINDNGGNFSEPATPAEVQTMIDSVNAAQTVLANIGTDADNGNNDNTGTLSASDLNNIVGVSGATAANEQAYQDYIASHPNAFSSPATAAEVQAMVDAVNTSEASLAEVAEDIAGNANGTPVTAAELNSITGVSGAVAGTDYSAALAAAANTNPSGYADPANPTPAEIQAVIDAVNAGPDTDGDGVPDSIDLDDDNDGLSDLDEIAVGTDPLDANSNPTASLAEVAEDIAGNANGTPVTAAELNSITGVSGAVAGTDYS